MIHILSSVQIKKHNIGFYLYSLTLFIEYIHIVLKNKVPPLYLVLPLLQGPFLWFYVFLNKTSKLDPF